MATLYHWLAEIAYRRVKPSTIAFIDDKDLPNFVAWLQSIAGDFLVESVRKSSRTVANIALATQHLEHSDKALFVVLDNHTSWAQGIKNTAIIDVATLPTPEVVKKSIITLLWPGSPQNVVERLVLGDVIPKEFAAYCGLPRPRPPLALIGLRAQKLAYLLPSAESHAVFDCLWDKTSPQRGLLSAVFSRDKDAADHALQKLRAVHTILVCHVRLLDIIDWNTRSSLSRIISASGGNTLVMQLDEKDLPASEASSSIVFITPRMFDVPTAEPGLPRLVAASAYGQARRNDPLTYDKMQVVVDNIKKSIAVMHHEDVDEVLEHQVTLRRRAQVGLKT